MANQQKEILPPGVGRIPQWWMEITPHYTLDLEEEENRLRMEEQMAGFYQQMAEAADAGYLDENGNPILGPDGQPIAGWSPIKWAGRSSQGGGGSGGNYGPLGRNFVPGQVTPEALQLLGIDNTDPDYKSYLAGAKFPPGYWEKLAELGYTGPGFSASNLHQTDYGRYGRQAEKPKHQPDWMKKKLRSTNHGQAIRQGDYVSPEKAPMRRVQEATSVPPTQGISAPPFDDSPKPKAAAPQPTTAYSPSQNASPPPGKKKLIRKVRKVRRKKRDGEEAPKPAAPPAPAPAPMPTPSVRPAPPQKPEPVVPKPLVSKYSHKDYYYNAPNEQANAGAARPEQAPPRKQAPPSPKKHTPHHNEHYHDHEDEDYDEEEVIEEEVIDDSEVYEEEVVEESFTEDYEEEGGGDDISDLKAILAAKQAELARLQAQMMRG